MAWRILCFLPLAGLAVLCMLSGWAVAGWPGALAGLGIAGAVCLLGGDRLTVNSGASVRRQPTRKRLSPGFREKLNQMGDQVGLPEKPVLGFVDGPPNAFTHVSDGGNVEVIVSESLHDLLSERQLLAVAAHELAHVSAGDHWRLVAADMLGRVTQGLAIVALVAGAMSFIVWGHVLSPNWVWWTLAFGPTVMSGLHLWLSRRGEFRADAEAARLTEDPLALSQALARIQFATTGGLDLRVSLEEFAGIRRRGWWRTHPPVQDRIDRLQRMAGRLVT